MREGMRSSWARAIMFFHIRDIRGAVLAAFGPITTYPPLTGMCPEEVAVTTTMVMNRPGFSGDFFCVSHATDVEQFTDSRISELATIAAIFDGHG